MQFEVLLPLMMLRQNIYTDPQKPIQVEPKVYPIGEPGPDSPVLATTNFSLTYFLVSGEIENSGVPAHLVIVECEGMSVLTAWAAGKFTGAKVARRGEGERHRGAGDDPPAHHPRLRRADQRASSKRHFPGGRWWSDRERRSISARFLKRQAAPVDRHAPGPLSARGASRPRSPPAP